VPRDLDYAKFQRIKLDTNRSTVIAKDARLSNNDSVVSFNVAKTDNMTSTPAKLELING